jgi:peptidoglycan/LPS O-acetylase OafA/YrhL
MAVAETTAELDTASSRRSGRLSRWLLPHRGSRFSALDGYRALAALGVLVYHLTGALGWHRLDDEAGIVEALLNNLGNFGVAVFFLLSGFLLYRPFARAALADEPSPGMARFFRHRVLRIYPAYWVALTAVIVLLGVANPSPRKYVILFLLVQNYFTGHALLGLGVAWTLVIEMSFYVALPFIAGFIRLLGRVASSARGRMLAQFLGLGLMTAGSLVYRYTLAVPDRPFAPATQLWLPNYLDWFALGMLLAVCVIWSDLGNTLPRWFQALADNWWAPLLLSAQCYVVLALLRLSAGSGAPGRGPDSATEMSIRFFFNGIGAFLLLLPGVLGRWRSDRLHRGLDARSLAALGTVSYGIYLWHTIWIKVVAEWIWGTKLPPGTATLAAELLLIVGVLGLTLVSALASFVLIEHPIMRFKDPRRPNSGRRSEKPIAATMVGSLPVTGASSGLAGPDMGDLELPPIT